MNLKLTARYVKTRTYYRHYLAIRECNSPRKAPFLTSVILPKVMGETQASAAVKRWLRVVEGATQCLGILHVDRFPLTLLPPHFDL